MDNKKIGVAGESELVGALSIVRKQLGDAVAAKKCHSCGCFRSTVEALAATDEGQQALSDLIATARIEYQPKKYDCLGCAVCYPAIAANAFADVFPDKTEGLDLCPTEAPEERRGWPPLPGDFRVFRFGAPVAVCVLNTEAMIASLARAAHGAISIAGTLHTENLGIERIIRVVLANPNIRFLILCGEDTQQAIGHLPGQSLASLFRNGLNERGRIIGADGKRPFIKNVSQEAVGMFLRQIELVDLIGETSVERIVSTAEELVARYPGVFKEKQSQTAFEPIETEEPTRLVPDPAGYFVVYPDAARQRIVLEHYTNAGELDCVLAGSTPAALYGEVIARNLISRLDHAAYLGRELARAEHSLQSGTPYEQDRAAGEESPGEVPDPIRAVPHCGCETPCAGEGKP